MNALDRRVTKLEDAERPRLGPLALLVDDTHDSAEVSQRLAEYAEKFGPLAQDARVLLIQNPVVASAHAPAGSAQLARDSN